MSDNVTCKLCVYNPICIEGKLCTKNCRDYTPKWENRKPDKNGFIEYSVETAFPYILVRCRNVTQVRKAKSKLRKIGRKVTGVAGLTELGNDFLVNI